MDRFVDCGTFVTVVLNSLPPQLPSSPPPSSHSHLLPAHARPVPVLTCTPLKSYQLTQPQNFVDWTGSWTVVHLDRCFCMRCAAPAASGSTRAHRPDNKTCSSISWLRMIVHRARPCVHNTTILQQLHIEVTISLPSAWKCSLLTTRQVAAAAGRITWRLSDLLSPHPPSFFHFLFAVCDRKTHTFDQE